MFQRRYRIMLYKSGKNTPDIEFFVDAQRVESHEHYLRVDGIVFEFDNDCYVAFELA